MCDMAGTPGQMKAVERLIDLPGNGENWALLKDNPF